ncbi:hypothetical protein C8024_14965 [Sphingopyxis sp. BSNA05]|nr:hypothetical protein [Sphingopyxis sp. BSNA05]
MLAAVSSAEECGLPTDSETKSATDKQIFAPMQILPAIVCQRSDSGDLALLIVVAGLRLADQGIESQIRPEDRLWQAV